MDMLLVDNRCMVPWELLSASGKIAVTVFGGNLITVNQAVIFVGDCCVCGCRKGRSIPGRCAGLHKNAVPGDYQRANNQQMNAIVE
jgi:hypothetical protein